jgi:NAD(P)-dependent dehydrogenase (short-subunit alcohol dehydrogenase family)
MNNKVINEVQEKVAIVTGAASGIGRATVELLQARGALATQPGKLEALDSTKAITVKTINNKVSDYQIKSG